MPADNFLHYRAQISTAVFALGTLVRNFEDPQDLLAGISQMASELKAPVRIAIVGDVGAGKSTLMNVLFETSFCGVNPSSPNKPIYVYRHTSQESIRIKLPGIVEEMLDHGFLRDFLVVDTPGLRDGDTQLLENIEFLFVEVDVLLFAFSAKDPWKAELWDFLTRNRKFVGKACALLVLQSDRLPKAELESLLRYFRQTAARKLGDENVHVIALSARHAQMALGGEGDPEGLARSSNLTELYRFIDEALAFPHPRTRQLADLALRGRDLARQASQFAREALEGLRQDERAIFEMERGIITQYGQVRKELQSQLQQLAQKSLEPLETVEASFVASIKPTRLDIMARNREELARALQESLAEPITTMFSNAMDETAGTFEKHLADSWQSLLGRLRPQFIKDLRGPLSAFPHLKEAHGALLTRVGLHAQETLLSDDVVQQARGMLGQAAAINLQPVVILFASILAGAVAAFQSGCEFAGGMIFTVGILAAVWSVIAGIGFRRLVRRQYRQMCDSQVRELHVRVREELEGFAESILDETGKKLRTINEMSYSRRTAQEPLVEKAFRIGENLDQLAARVYTDEAA